METKKKREETQKIGGNEFIDEKFNIVPVKAVIPDIKKDTPTVETQKFSEADLFSLSETATSLLPCLIWQKLTPVPKPMIETFNHEFYLYCVRKGIDPRDYLFDELGIAISAYIIGSFHYKNYRSAYITSKDQKTEDKLNIDHAHKLDIDTKNEEKKTEVKACE